MNAVWTTPVSRLQAEVSKLYSSAAIESSLYFCLRSRTARTTFVVYSLYFHERALILNSNLKWKLTAQFELRHGALDSGYVGEISCNACYVEELLFWELRRWFSYCSWARIFHHGVSDCLYVAMCNSSCGVRISNRCLQMPKCHWTRRRLRPTINYSSSCWGSKMPPHGEGNRGENFTKFTDKCIKKWARWRMQSGEKWFPIPQHLTNSFRSSFLRADASRLEKCKYGSVARYRRNSRCRHFLFLWRLSNFFSLQHFFSVFPKSDDTWIFLIQCQISNALYHWSIK